MICNVVSCMFTFTISKHCLVFTLWFAFTILIAQKLKNSSYCECELRSEKQRRPGMRVCKTYKQLA